LTIVGRYFGTASKSARRTTTVSVAGIECEEMSVDSTGTRCVLHSRRVLAQYDNLVASHEADVWL
jgi:hypothetical protein